LLKISFAAEINEIHKVSEVSIQIAVKKVRWNLKM
jgi:hypothetical protein